MVEALKVLVALSFTIGAFGFAIAFYAAVLAAFTWPFWIWFVL